MVSSARSAPEKVLGRVFGHQAFRMQQAQVIEHVMAGGDALVLMPTGGGKSLCYQVPALLLDGTAVVVSPLIALMHDQVQALRARGVRAASLNSTLTHEQSKGVEQSLSAGELDLLYVAPERLVRPRLMQLLKNIKVSLLAIDEAHCVSQWGHDFRPEYLALESLADHWPGVPRLALTATATPATRKDILDRLRLPHATIFASGFDRPNIFYEVVDKADVRAQLLAFINTRYRGRSGIVYTASRARAQALASWLNRHGINALPYHAGLDREQRTRHQARFVSEPDLVMVATIAFGMGIDKPDVRFVAHVDMPRSLEHYYQETGRVGRDGQPATAWMAYGLSDVAQRYTLARETEASASQAQRVMASFDQMLQFAESLTCRRVQLLAHFGQDSHACGHCDNCQMLQRDQPLWDATEAAQMVLSTVYRLWRERGQRYGSGHLIDIVRGKRTTRVVAQGHDSLSVFGVGAQWSVLTWRNVVRRLMAEQMLVTDDEGYGTLAMTPASVPVFKGERRLWMRRDSISQMDRPD
ncbi:DNA helicase RecQ [Orrella daihaiensis]|uniref:DNA helicase RecQ n=2 Tax=Orrella daihaiensis TaxID=2782176 RepID=A0ABY4ARC7_9BURK|nr:DNA helicase RecQ [Orrella daihaiensis]